MSPTLPVWRMRWLAVLVAAALAVLLPAGSATAADDASVAHVEAGEDGLRILVNVPAGADVDLSGVTATLDGLALDAAAVPAGAEAVVERTTVLVMDVSNSMRQDARIDAAKDAATAFLDAVPADVRVGIVTFAGEVQTALEPTTDREAARAVVSGLDLRPGTALYDGVLSAVDVAGTEGQRSLLVLSDGKDTGKGATIEEVTASVGEAQTLVDVVSLGGVNIDMEALEDLAGAGSGRVIESSGAELSQTFEAEADVLAGQVLVTAPLPPGFDESEATVEVTLPTPDGDLVASAFAPIQEVSDEDSGASSAPVNPGTAWQMPDWALWAGLGAFGLGLLVTAVLLVPGRPAPMTIDERLTAYSRTTPTGYVPPEKPAPEPVLTHATAAVDGVLHRNARYEEKVASRLTAAGSQLKPSEWVLVQVAVVLGAAVLGTLVGGGNIFIALAFVVPALFLPRIYLGFRTSRRRKKFNALLPETLQLISGSLAAGLSLAQSCDTVVRDGPELIASEFKRVLVETRIGVPLETAFEGIAERFDSKDFAWVVMAIRIQRQVGGNLAELLNTVAATMRERQYLRRQVSSLSAEGRLSAMILAALPPVVMIWVLMTNRQYMMPLFTETLGLMMLGGAALWLAIGVFWMSRMVKVEV